MLDPKWIREQIDEVRSMLECRNMDLDLSELSALEVRRREILVDVEARKARRNEGSKTVGAKRKAGENCDALMEEMRCLGEEIKELDAELERIERDFEAWMLKLPNRPLPSVPVGKNEEDNVVVRTWGTPRALPFEPKPHWEIAEALDILDFERGVKLAESRFTVVKGLGAKLARALINFMLDLHTNEHGFMEINPPILVNTATMRGTGQLPKFAEDQYRCANDDLWLIPTAEVPLTNLHAEEILDEAELPKHYTAYTPCFRREAGAAGRDMRGMLRQHQFDKVELVKLCAPQNGEAELEHLTNCAEKVLQLLELPYRVMALCTGDMGFASAKTYDLEVWLPYQNCYREISSCSICTDFQARRMNTRYRPEAGGRPQYVCTLNGSGIAIGRALIAILENGQNSDGSVTIPRALRPYMRELEAIVPH